MEQDSALPPLEVSRELANTSARILERVRIVEEFQFFARRCEVLGALAMQASHDDHVAVKWEGAALIGAIKSVYGE